MIGFWWQVPVWWAAITVIVVTFALIWLIEWAKR